MSTKTKPAANPFAEFVEQARQEQGLSIARLAHAADVGNGSAQRVLSGQLDYSASVAVKLGLALGLSPEELGKLLANTHREKPGK